MDLASDENVRSSQIYLPFKAGFPNIREYVKDIFRRREFISELSRVERASDNLNTLFGSIWGLINPLLSAVTYFLFIFILQGSQQGSIRFLHLLAGIFIFQFISRCASKGSTSIVSASGLINNTRFPRAIIPLAFVLSAWKSFIPSIFVYAFFHAILLQPLHLNALQAIPAIILCILFASGLAMFAATAQIYLRDTQSLIPFFLQLLMFASPVLYFPEQAKVSLGGDLLGYINPIYKIVEIFSGSLVRGDSFGMTTWITAISWSIGMFLLGFTFLVRREGEFAARI